MLTLREIYQFVSDRNNNELKDYYDKGYDTLKEMNKRSNLLTLFILVLLALSFFPTFIKDSEISGFKVSIEIIKLLCPLLIPYFLLEWCLIARRRRDEICRIQDIQNTHFQGGTQSIYTQYS